MGIVNRRFHWGLPLLRNFEPMAKIDKLAKRRLRTSYLSTIFGLSLVLSLLGMAAWFIIVADDLSSTVKEEMEIDVYFRDAAAEADIQKIEKELIALDYVLQATYVSRDSAFASLNQGMGDEAMEILGYIPLQPSINVHLRADHANADSAASFEEYMLVGNEDLIEDVYYSPGQFMQINAGVGQVQKWILLIAGLLLIISIALINNTIRLALHSHRFIIKTMQLVGARPKFIKRPYLRTALAQGFISGIIAISILLGMGWAMATFNPDLFGGEEYKFVSMPDAGAYQKDFQIFAKIFGGIIVGGIVITYVSTWLALQKYIRVRTDSLY